LFFNLGGKDRKKIVEVGDFDNHSFMIAAEVFDIN